MARDPALRANFVASVVEFLLRFGFDGLDFDWEYPANRGGVPEDQVSKFIECYSFSCALRLSYYLAGRLHLHYR